MSPSMCKVFSVHRTSERSSFPGRYLSQTHKYPSSLPLTQTNLANPPNQSDWFPSVCFPPGKARCLLGRMPCGGGQCCSSHGSSHLVFQPHFLRRLIMDHKMETLVESNIFIPRPAGGRGSVEKQELCKNYSEYSSPKQRLFITAMNKNTQTHTRCFPAPEHSTVDSRAGSRAGGTGIWGGGEEGGGLGRRRRRMRKVGWG